MQGTVRGLMGRAVTRAEQRGVWYLDCTSSLLPWSGDVYQTKNTCVVKLMASVLGGCCIYTKSCMYRF